MTTAKYRPISTIKINNETHDRLKAFCNEAGYKITAIAEKAVVRLLDELHAPREASRTCAPEPDGSDVVKTVA